MKKEWEIDDERILEKVKEKEGGRDSMKRWCYNEKEKWKEWKRYKKK